MTDQIDECEALIWQVVHAIPEGKVATYGQIAAMAGIPQHARMVGRVLSRLPKGSRLPWHRVLNAQGKITNPNAPRQVERLRAEGVHPVNGRVNLTTYRWDP